MYPAAFEYHAPTSVRDALGLLGQLGDDAKIVAGGHSLIPMMKLRLAQPKNLVDLRKVPGLGFWAGFDRGDFIGWWILQPPHGPDQPEVAGEADLGFRLLRRHWRRGYAAEGARELIRYGFGGVGLNRIFAQTMAVNTPSRATLAAVGLTFAWKKIPVDTLVQEAIPDGYRGRVFAVYDVLYNLSRVAAAFLAIPMLNAFNEAWSVAIVGIVFLLWAPVLPRWIGRRTPLMSPLKPPGR